MTILAHVNLSDLTRRQTTTDTRHRALPSALAGVFHNRARNHGVARLLTRALSAAGINVITARATAVDGVAWTIHAARTQQTQRLMRLQKLLVSLIRSP